MPCWIVRTTLTTPVLASVAPVMTIAARTGITKISAVATAATPVGTTAIGTTAVTAAGTTTIPPVGTIAVIAARATAARDNIMIAKEAIGMRIAVIRETTAGGNRMIDEGVIRMSIAITGVEISTRGTRVDVTRAAPGTQSVRNTSGRYVPRDDFEDNLYCWSHGLRSHTGRDCRNPRGNHATDDSLDRATRHNCWGGYVRNMRRLLRCGVVELNLDSTINSNERDSIYSTICNPTPCHTSSTKANIEQKLRDLKKGKVWLRKAVKALVTGYLPTTSGTKHQKV